MIWKIWKNQIDDKHFWAFYYFCKRQGDKLKFNKNGTINLLVGVKDE